MSVRVKTKKPCCQSNPRCKTCPVVMQRLDKAGLAERITKRRYVLAKAVTKKDFKAFRAR